MKFVCTICGFIYDEADGHPASGLAPGTLWDDVPADWLCPLCGAAKADFKAVNTAPNAQPATENARSLDGAAAGAIELAPAELSALFSNLAKGCDKQYRPEEARLFTSLSDFYARQIPEANEASLTAIAARIESDLAAYDSANSLAAGRSDRGALRALAWSEKVTRMLAAHLRRYAQEQATMLAETNIFVCEICGFIYIGDEAPEICPVCKVPSFKLAPVQRRS